ncbi:cytochrome P450 [Actinomycetospora chiangmaiensis]|uniref:cytochrome P450 n=1 Tax=Actinomycetospora chiangmaiensis TaxID=402650 RepID=UPI00036FF734|nr:cytochrome P450 [Actinomycetospora chiangmaiensis]
MTAGGDEPRPRLPLSGDALLRPDPRYGDLRDRGPLARVLTPAGDEAWLAVRYAETRALFADPRLGRSHPHPAEAARISDSGVQGGAAANYATEAADHAFMRRLVAPSFSARRVARLGQYVQQLLDGYLDEMIREHDRTGAPVDLHAWVTGPLPVRMIGELLGVPAADHGHFRDLADRAGGLRGTAPRAAIGELVGYATSLLECKRATPGDDVVSDLVAAQDEHPDFTDEAAVGILIMLLIAGHETTVSFTDMGVLLLLRHRAVLDALGRDASLADQVVEEVLRVGSSGGVGMVRYAHTDVDVVAADGTGTTIRAGDAVILSMSSANRDERAFDDPSEFRPFAPSAAPHVGLGHGPRFCLGAPLARLEMRAVLSTLAARLPGLRLAGEESEVITRRDSFMGGIESLPVTW